MRETKQFVLDANTLISAFLLSHTSVAARAYYKAKAEGEIIFFEDTFNEFGDVFIRPKFDRYLSLPKRLAIIDDLKEIVKFITVTNIITICRDPKDNKFLELAVEADADCIVTGDKDLLVLHPFQNIPILIASGFLEKFR